MKRPAILIACLLMALCACSSAPTERDSLGTVTYSVRFAVADTRFAPLAGVTLTCIDRNGAVAGEFQTDDNGHANPLLTVPADPRYAHEEAINLEPRGTVTVIASKQGYCIQVVLEVPVSSADALQCVVLSPKVKGLRNEPNVQLGYSHHLEIISLVEKYVGYTDDE